MIYAIGIFFSIANWYIIGFWRRMVHFHRFYYFWYVGRDVRVICESFLLKNIERYRRELVLVTRRQAPRARRAFGPTGIIVLNGLDFWLNDIDLVVDQIKMKMIKKCRTYHLNVIGLFRLMTRTWIFLYNMANDLCWCLRETTPVNWTPRH